MSGDLTKVHPCEPDEHTFGFAEGYDPPGTIYEERNENPRMDFGPSAAEGGDRIDLDPLENAGPTTRRGGHETKLVVDELRLEKMNIGAVAEQLSLKVTMKNAGTVPAYGLSVFGSSGLAATPRDKRQENDIVKEISSMMSPQVQQARNSATTKVAPKGRFSFTFRGPTLNPELFEQVEEGKEVVYYTGIVLGNAITRFCLYTSGDLSRMHNCTPDTTAFEVDEAAPPGLQLKRKR
jgi:hypothetical protein